MVRDKKTMKDLLFRQCVCEYIGRRENVVESKWQEVLTLLKSLQSLLGRTLNIDKTVSNDLIQWLFSGLKKFDILNSVVGGG